MTLTLELFISHFSDLLANTGFCFAVPEFLSFFSFWNPVSPRREGVNEMFSRAKLILGPSKILSAFPVIRCRPYASDPGLWTALES